MTLKQINGRGGIVLSSTFANVIFDGATTRQEYLKHKFTTTGIIRLFATRYLRQLKDFIRLTSAIGGAVEDITVVVPIKDRYDFRLINAFASIRNQTYPQHLVKLKLVDYGSAKSFEPLYVSLCSQHDAEYIRVVPNSVWSKSHACNIGIKKANTKYVLTADGDCIFEKTYIEKAIAALKKNPFQVVVCKLNELAKGDVNGVVDLKNNYKKLFARSKEVYPMACGIQLTLTFFYHWARGFDERYMVYGKEDKDMLKRFLMMGLRFCDLSAKISLLHQGHKRYEGYRALFPRYYKRNTDYYFKSFSIVRNKTMWGKWNPVKPDKIKKNVRKIVISTVYFGGIGGSERRLKAIIESLPEHEFYIFAPYSVRDGFFPTTRNYHLNIPLDKSVLYDLYIYFAGMTPRYLGHRYCFNRKIAIINGTEKFSAEQLFDYAVLSGKNGARCLNGNVKTLFAIPEVRGVHPKRLKKIDNLPKNFLLTVFNPYGPVKGKEVLEKVAPYSNFPIVWCYNDMTRSRHLKGDYKALGPIDNVIQLRNISQAELFYLYKRASAYVSFSIQEGFGWAVADAFAYDLPIISRNTGIVTFFDKQKGVAIYNSQKKLMSCLAQERFEKPSYDKSCMTRYGCRELINKLLLNKPINNFQRAPL